MRTYDLATPEGFDPQVSLLLGALDDSTREWRDNLGSPSIEAIQWPGFENGHSIGSCILHNIDAEAYWFETFCAGVRRPPGETNLLLAKEIRVYGPHWPTPPARPIEWFYELHDQVRARSRRALEPLAAEQMVVRKNYQATVRWVIAHVIEHDSYHGGQAVLLHEMWRKCRTK